MKNIIIVVAIIAAGYLAYQHFFNTPPDENMIFTLNKCELCDIAKELLDENEIEYTEFNVEESDENFALFKKYKGKTLPLLFFKTMTLSLLSTTLENPMITLPNTDL